jgi:hypothetical protein
LQVARQDANATNLARTKNSGILIRLVPNGPVAQRLEQGTHNPLVPGSNPGGPILFSIFDFRFAIVDLVQRVARIGLLILELLILSALILAARCANYQDVFVAGSIYFTDADCYARMTRVRMCEKKPGLIIRHHDFENFPQGTIPHTTAPLDYLILELAVVLKPLTAHAIDLAGALISPLLALFGGWFLWWWSRRMNFRYRWILLILYAISPVLAHGTKLGRPDHHSLVVLLVTVAICSEWTLQFERSTKWSIVNGMAWSLALWVSLYEPLVLFTLVACCAVLQDREFFRARHRRIGWTLFFVILAFAFLIERRLPQLRIFYSGHIFENWSRTIAELVSVSPTHPIWFQWASWLLIAAPILIWFALRRKRPPPIFVSVLLIASYLLTIWQARWAYFFASIFALALPSLLELFRSRILVWSIFIVSVFPILRDWDTRLWPDEAELARRIEQRNESVQLRELALNLQSSERHPFLAQWWLSPALAYWSSQPGVAGSSHESLPGIEESARFFVSQDWETARKILQIQKIAWVIVYDSERAAQNSAEILGSAVPQHPVCFVLDRTPSQVPRFLVFSAQIGIMKLYRSVEL